MCNDNQPDETSRRALSLAGLLESCARMFRASLGRDPDHIERATNATHWLAYDLEHQPNTSESNEDYALRLKANLKAATDELKGAMSSGVRPVSRGVGTARRS